MPRLTEPEKQEILRFVEADKPLPDKYRFLLFEDKREVELVWNGKTSEVCNIVLPFQVIEQVDEPRAEKPDDTALTGSRRRTLLRAESRSQMSRFARLGRTKPTLYVLGYSRSIASGSSEKAPRR